MDQMAKYQFAVTVSGYGLTIWIVEAADEATAKEKIRYAYDHGDSDDCQYLEDMIGPRFEPWRPDRKGVTSELTFENITRFRDRLTVDRAIDADPLLKEIFERPRQRG
jgi:hypothetical protein